MSSSSPFQENTCSPLPSRFHLKVCFVAGVGFFTDAYGASLYLRSAMGFALIGEPDLFAINIASIMLGNLYGPDGSES